MKDAVGSSLLVYLVIIIVGIVGACVIASNAYSKAYKAKNNIITSIDKYYLVNTDSGEGSTSTTTDCFQDEICKTTIKNTLNNMGYHLSVSVADCELEQIRKKINSNADSNAAKSYIIYPTGEEKSDGYCIYKTEVNDTDYYYTVITFSHLNINVLGIGTLFKTPVYGETRVYYDYSKGA